MEGTFRFDVLAPRTGKHQKSTSPEATGQGGQETNARLIGPVEIFENEHDGTTRGQSFQEPRHRLEESTEVAGGTACARWLFQLRKQPGKFGLPHRGQILLNPSLAERLGVSHGIDPGPESNGPRTL